jgi:hypothetical protein
VPCARVEGGLPPRTLHRGRWGSSCPRGHRSVPITTTFRIGCKESAVAYQLCALLTHERWWDNRWFNSVENARAEENASHLCSKAFVLLRDQRAVGVLVTRKRYVSRVAVSMLREQGSMDGIARDLCVDHLFLCANHRSKGLGSASITHMVNHYGIDPFDLGWAEPLSNDGERIARRFTRPSSPITLV